MENLVKMDDLGVPLFSETPKPLRFKALCESIADVAAQQSTKGSSEQHQTRNASWVPGGPLMFLLNTFLDVQKKIGQMDGTCR